MVDCSNCTLLAICKIKDMIADISAYGIVTFTNCKIKKLINCNSSPISREIQLQKRDYREFSLQAEKSKESVRQESQEYVKCPTCGDSGKGLTVITCESCGTTKICDNCGIVVDGKTICEKCWNE